VSAASLEEKFRNLPEPLTDREIEIAKLAAQGMRNKEIAACCSFPSAPSATGCTPFSRSSTSTAAPS
jgi:hypothetical protein